MCSIHDVTQIRCLPVPATFARSSTAAENPALEVTHFPLPPPESADSHVVVPASARGLPSCAKARPRKHSEKTRGSSLRMPDSTTGVVWSVMLSSITIQKSGYHSVSHGVVTMAVFESWIAVLSGTWPEFAVSLHNGTISYDEKRSRVSLNWIGIRAADVSRSHTGNFHIFTA